MIICILGASASGKDTIYKDLLKDFPLNRLTTCTTRPIRKGEKNGREYCFVDFDKFLDMKVRGDIIEFRPYYVHGSRLPWMYFTPKTVNVNLDYLVIASPEQFLSYQNYFGRDKVVGIYIDVPSFQRLIRSLKRESLEENPDYEEVIRRFEADKKDFANIKHIVDFKAENLDYETCFSQVKDYIKRLVF